MRRFTLSALTSAGLLAVAFPAAAQVTETWRPPPEEPIANRSHVTSSEDATKPSPAEQREARALAVAVFARVAAAQKAADKADAANATAIAPAEPKPEWVAKDGVGFGGKGVQVKAPF